MKSTFEKMGGTYTLDMIAKVWEVAGLLVDEKM